MKIIDYARAITLLLLLINYAESYANVKVNNKSQIYAKLVKEFNSCIFTQRTTIKNRLVIDFSGKITGKRTLTPLPIGFNPAFRLYNRDEYSNDKINKLFKIVGGVKALRFPGGTSANFFDWEAETLDEGAIEIIRKKSMLNAVANQKRKNKGKLIKSSLSRFEYITNEYGIDKFITLNLYTKDLKYNFKLIDRIKNKISSRINWELGNELLNPQYESSYFSKFQWNHKIYLDKAIVIAKYIKEKYPQDLVGVTGGELINERRIQGDAPERIVAKEAAWNNLIANNKYIDAVIFHPYINLFYKKNWQRKRMEDINCKTNNIDIKKAALEFRWVLGQAQSVPEEYSRYVKNTMPNKKIWITESGLLGKGRSNILNWKTGVLRILFNLTYYISWVADVNNLDVYMYHMLGYGQGANQAAFLDGSLKSNTIAYEFIGALLSGAENIFFKEYKIKNGLRTLKSNKNVSTVEIMGTETRHGLRILLVNIGSEPAIIKLPGKNYCVRVIGGDPFSKVLPGQYKNFQDITLHRLTSDYWNIPSFSASLIEKCSLGNDK